jgi:hypothetical protein
MLVSVCYMVLVFRTLCWGHVFTEKYEDWERNWGIVGTEVRGRPTKSPQGIQKSHFVFPGATETLCAPDISSYTVQ